MHCILSAKTSSIWMLPKKESSACVTGVRRHRAKLEGLRDTALEHDGVSVVMFALLAYSLYHFARKPLDSR